MKNKIIIGLLSIICFTSCQMLEGEGADEQAYGELQLSVEKKLPGTRAAGDVDTQDFKVSIDGASSFHAEYTVAELPEVLTLPLGEYTVKANTPLAFEKKMTMPYFLGEESMTIENGIRTKVGVECKQKNSRIEINYGEAFLAAYSAWTITIDDGSESALFFDNTDATINPVYWQFGENVETLHINLVATPVNGGKEVEGSMTITKADATEHYDDDNQFYAGGDAIEINFTLGGEDIPQTTGNANIAVTVNATFENSDESVTIPVVWDDDKPSTSGDDDNKPGNEAAEPTLVFSSPSVTASAAGGPELTATINAEAGLKSMIVKASSTGDFQATLPDLEETGLMLLTGHELVDDTILPALFEGLGVPATAPSKGDTEYVFNIANFYEFLAIYGAGDTTFAIVVEDMNGKKVEGSVLVKITE